MVLLLKLLKVLSLKHGFMIMKFESQHSRKQVFSAHSALRVIL